MLQWWDQRLHRHIRHVLLHPVTQISQWNQNTQWKRGPATRLERSDAGFFRRKKFSIPGIGFLPTNSTFYCQYHSISAPELFIHTPITVHSLQLTSDSVLEQQTITQSLTMRKSQTTITVSFLNYLRMLFEVDAAPNKMEQSRRNVSRQGFVTNIF